LKSFTHRQVVHVSTERERSRPELYKQISQLSSKSMGSTRPRVYGSNKQQEVIRPAIKRRPSSIVHHTRSVHQAPLELGGSVRFLRSQISMGFLTPFSRFPAIRAWQISRRAPIQLCLPILALHFGVSSFCFSQSTAMA
jgi:hypothetical protein